MTIARLVLEDGTEYEGESFGAAQDSIGEVVFNTSQTGYQEIATDPSYRFQIVVMTTPHIGNYGVDTLFEQSEKPQLSGIAVRELAATTSQPDAQPALSAYLERHRIPGIAEIDTRALTRKIAEGGAQRGMITTNMDRSTADIVEEIRKSPSMSGLDLVKRVTTLRPYIVDAIGEKRHRVAVYDFGVKRDILHQLALRGAEVVVYPASTHADEIINQDFDGVVLSNGPGDPEPVTYAQDNIRRLIGRKPLFGICLGHQLLGLALGGKTYKLKFGHHGGNHPVRDVKTGKVEITAQNHGFSVDADSLNASEIDFTHVNLNDNTLEGFRHRNHPIIAVQYHPEAAPGPHDSFYLFDEFLSMAKELKKA
jgi:carbamoyl-phosphate synthase small subunit